LRTSLPLCDQQLPPPHWSVMAGIGPKVIKVTAPWAARNRPMPALPLAVRGSGVETVTGQRV
jgi:hypothetical protein